MGYWTQVMMVIRLSGMEHLEDCCSAAQLGDTDVDSAITGDFLVYDDGTEFGQVKQFGYP